jgi:hypothetical protein
MKFSIAFRGIVAAFVALAAQAVIGGTLSGSGHDFSAAGWNPGGKVCNVCHTPHKSDTTVSDAPLWNHKLTTATYTLYSSPTLKAAPMSQPGGTSKLCLSCHDGTVAIDSFGGATGSMMISNAAFKPTSNIGTSLADDHPIGFTYDSALATLNGSLFDPSTKSVTIGTGAQTRTATIASNMLFGGKMECSSCHDVHNTFSFNGTKGAGMVKMDTAGSKICLACHNK